MRVLKATALTALAAAISAEPPTPSWFSTLSGSGGQTITSAATNTIDVDAASWTAPPSYGAPEGSTLPYPLVVDNTEGIGAAAHVLAIHGFGADVGADAEPVLVVDLGGGQFDGVPDWCSTHAPHCTVLIADPFQRTPDHNEQVRTACQDTMVHTPLKCRQ